MRTALLGALLAALLAGCAGGPTGGMVAGGEVDDDGYAGAALDTPYTVPTTALTDTDGDARALTDSQAPLTLVFFGYTKCPDICQIVMSNIASALTRLDEADRERVEVAFVTTDPARDTAPVLRDYLDQFDPSFTGLTADLPTVVEVARELKVFVEKGQKLPSGGYEVVHGDPVLGVEDGERATIVWPKETSAAELAADIERFLDEAGS